jgi:hypothetical protein
MLSFAEENRVIEAEKIANKYLTKPPGFDSGTG